MSAETSADVIVLGAGAAGLMAAFTAGRRGRRVIMLERGPEVGAKILISGGGRCNFTNLEADRPERYISDNPHFAKSALARYGPGDFLDLVRAHRIAFYEKTLGQLFCEGAGSARKIVAMLMAECAAAGVDVRTDVAVTQVAHAGGFRVETSAGVFTAPTLICATGGPSIPKLGATGFAFELAAQFGVPVVRPRPALVPLTLTPEDRAWTAPLAGVAVPVLARAEGPAFREAALFTHKGLSGPAVLQASTYWRAGRPLHLDFDPDTVLAGQLLAAKRARPKAGLRAALAEAYPARLADAFAQRAAITAPLGDVKDAALAAAAAALKAFMLTPAGDEGYAKAEVTAGGVAADALDQRTMMVRAVPGLVFVGEAVDVTGWLGGYNFQWAWASGRAAGLAA
jgi:hypothetical protein